MSYRFYPDIQTVIDEPFFTCHGEAEGRGNPFRVGAYLQVRPRAGLKTRPYRLLRRLRVPRNDVFVGGVAAEAKAIRSSNIFDSITISMYNVYVSLIHI